MFAPRLPRLGTFAAWRETARRLACAGVAPGDVDWALDGEGPALFADPLPDATTEHLPVPTAFPTLARKLIPDRSGQGMALAYALLVRLQSKPGLLTDRADPDVAQAARIAKDVRRDEHKMHAFLRFREIEPSGSRRRFAAWFEPDHRIEEPVADFFVDRFGDMDWVIVTPDVTLSFLERRLRLTAIPSSRPEGEDPLQQLWTTYYENVFNPARLKVDAMRAEMPKKYWRNLPETRSIPSLIATARGRVAAMQEAGATEPAPPARLGKKPEMPNMSQTDLFGAPTLDRLRDQARACMRCPLHGPATQVVFGDGPADAAVMIVGEQPGDKEDLAGQPFVGPAGKLFDDVAERAGLDRSGCYVTNAVKHFKFVQKGRRRIHQTPAASEITACKSWLADEMRAVDPEIVVAMGATALQALTGKRAGLLKRRGTVERTTDGRPLLITVHPSYLLRLPDPGQRAEEEARFEADLRRVSTLLQDGVA
ncbi:MAG: UdgX family uracil-DNA binding protein [Pseudomonadota bacterium]